jgi:hypothetical protein
MYNQYLKVKPCKTGMGVFTEVEIPANVPIIEVTGNLYTEETMPDPNHPALLQVGPNLFIGPSGDTDDYINHSCNPNCTTHIVGNRAMLYSLYVINAGTELTFDYSTSSTDSLEKWSMSCSCGSQNCRKVISGFHLLDKVTQQSLKDKGMVPMFITNPIFIKK